MGDDARDGKIVIKLSGGIELLDGSLMLTKGGVDEAYIRKNLRGICDTLFIVAQSVAITDIR